MLFSIARAAFACVLLTTTSALSAQSLIYAYNLTIPLVAETPSYQSAIYIHNASTGTATVSVIYNGATQAAVVTGSVAGTVSNVKYNGSATVPARRRVTRPAAVPDTNGRPRWRITSCSTRSPGVAWASSTAPARRA